MKKSTSRLLSALLVLCMVLVLLPGTALAADSPAVSGNIYGAVYSYGRWATTVKSYLYADESGGLTRVEYINGQVVAEKYDSSFRFLSGQTVPMELSVWGGFYAGQDYNFLIFGQNNEEENNSKEVIRVVKYSKDWQRLGQASLYGTNTIHPFNAGSLRCDEYNGELYIRTCHEMYTTSDGLNHQANLTMAVRESDMTVLDSYYTVMNSSVGYVSHSFNQFVIVDQQQRIVTLDHGDAYPRGAVLMVYNAKAGQGKFSGSVSSATIQSFPGATGANDTGASLGGLAETSSGYVVAYNYDGAGSSRTCADRSVYFAYVDKSSRSVQTKVLSSAGTLPPFLAPTGLNGGYILWNASDAYGRGTDALYYAAYSDGGSVGEVKTATASLSDCQPIVYNGKVVWYTTNNTIPTFYQLDENGVTATAAKEALPDTPDIPDTPNTPDFKIELSAQNLTVDARENVACEKYNIDGNNYFKLRDLAALLSGTGSQFEVGYDDASKTISITTGKAYTPNGSELVLRGDMSGTAEVSAQTIQINGVKHDELKVYNIGGNNFFQLRQLGDLLGFDVDYDPAGTGTAIVKSK